MAIPIDVLSQVIGPLLHGADACRFGMVCKEFYATYLQRVPRIQRAFHILEVLERAETMNGVQRITKFLPASLLKCEAPVRNIYDLYTAVPVEYSSLVGSRCFSIHAFFGKMNGFSKMQYDSSWNVDYFTAVPFVPGEGITSQRTRGSFWMLQVGKGGETLEITFTRVGVLPGFERPGDNGVEWWLAFIFAGKKVPKQGAAFKQAMVVLDLFRKYNPEFVNVHVGSIFMKFQSENEGVRTFDNTPGLYKALRAHGVEPPTDAEKQAKAGVHML